MGPRILKVDFLYFNSFYLIFIIFNLIQQKWKVEIVKIKLNKYQPSNLGNLLDK